MSKPLRSVTAGLVAVLALAALGPAAAQGASRGPVRRVLIISLPRVTWVDLRDVSLPNIDRLLDTSAVADLSTRAVSRRTQLGGGYITLGAGTRAVGNTGVDGQAFGVDEQFGTDAAGEVFLRRTGVDPGKGIVDLAMPSIVDRNDKLYFDATPGELGATLAENGYHRAVIANGDGAEPAPDTNGDNYNRQAVASLMDSKGRLRNGTVGPSLLKRDASFPYGVRMDLDATERAFQRVWNPRSVVLVEASDLERSDSYRAVTEEEQRTVLLRQALHAADHLVGRLLEHVDLRRDAVLVVGPTHPRRGVGLTVAALHAPGVAPALLRSATTRRTGFVQLQDVAPTVLDLVGVDTPNTMEGREFIIGRAGGTAAERRAFLIDANRGANFRDHQINLVTLLFVLLQVALSATAMIALSRGRKRGVRPSLRSALEWIALSLLGVLPVTYLAGLLPFDQWGRLPFFAFLGGGGIVLAALYRRLGRRADVDPLILALGTIIGLLVVDIVTGGRLQFNTVFGYSPTVAGRFAGYGNTAYAMLAASAILLAGLLAFRIGGRRGRQWALAVLAIALIADISPFWGSDVGGALSMVPAFGITASMLYGVRIRLRQAVIWAGVTVLAVTGVGLLDLTRPVDQRTHLGRFFEKIGNEGWDGFQTVVLRKLLANLSVITTSTWTLMVPAVFAFIAYLVYRGPGRLRVIRDRIPQLRASLAGLLVVGVLGFCLNDSGISIPGVMLGVLNSVMVFLVVRLPDNPGPRWPLPERAQVEQPREPVAVS